MEPAALLKDADTLNLLDSFCRRTFANDADADECYLYILEKLQENDYRRLRKFNGKSTLKTWLYTVFTNLKADFIRSKFGRRHIPAAVQRIGLWAQAVYKLICYEKRSVEEAWIAVSAQKLYTHSTEQYLEDVEEVLVHPCPPSVQMVALTGEDSEQEDTKANPFYILLDKLDRERAAAAAGILRQTTAEFTARDKLIIEMAYSKNCKDTAIARVLGCDRRTVKKRRITLLNHYCKALFKEGISGL